MTDSVVNSRPFRLAMAASDDKAEAFRRAARHSVRVRRLRRLIVLGAILLATGIVVFAFFDPFRAVIPAGVSIGSAGLSGTTVTMANPKMAGYRKDGKPYDFKADTAVQDLRTPGVLQLNRLDAHVGMSDGMAHVVSDAGVYDTGKEIMDLKGNIRITTDAGADIRMRSAHIEFNGSNVSSQEPVSVVLPSGSVVSDAMHMTGNGADVTFSGHVHSTVQPATDALHGTRSPGDGAP